jgi:hypothetical protein
MIAKYRNRGIIQIVCALVLTVLLVVLIRNRGPRVSDDKVALGFLLYCAAWTMWMVASFSLAKARGYASDFTGTLFLLFFIVGFCFPIAPMLFPLYIVFALKDKTRDRHGDFR